MKPVSTSPSVRPEGTGPRILPLLLFVSGALALVYEVLWQRQFALVFGSASPATAAVLAAYFAGLGVGSVVVGRMARRWRRPLLAYAALELGIGGGALLVSPLLSWFAEGYPALFAALADNPAGFTAVRATMVFIALLLPTFCMGGTLPLLGQFVDAERKQLGLTAGWLYVANTAGASIGALSVPFLFLPALGLSRTVWLCVAGNLGLALVAWRLNEKGTRTIDRASPPANKVTRSDETAAMLVLASISGAATFALQVLWNRAFAQVHENSMYSFSVIVAVVILALAIGAQWARLGLRRGLEPRRLIGGAWIAAGIVVVAGPAMFLKLTGGMAYLPAGDGWFGHAGALIGFAGVLVFPAMALLGIGLPAIMEETGRRSHDDAGRVLGRLLGVNIAGSVLGALLAGFVLPSLLGMWNAVIACGALLLAAGVWQWRRASWRFGAAMAAAWIASIWPTSRLELPRVRLSPSGDERLLSLAEGTHGITAVVEREGSRRLKLNNHYALGGTASTGDERMQAHVPLLLHAAPREVAFLGLGTGISAGGALFHPVERVTVMELVPEVVEAARAQFREANHAVLESAQTRVVVDDARNYLRGSRERFDVIVGDLVVPWRQGEGSLFTLEQFRAAHRALAPGGVYCQWLPLFQLSEAETLILARTFLAVFPRAMVWRGDFSPTEPAIALIGAADDFDFDPAVVERRLAAMPLDPTNSQLRAPGAFWMNFVGVLETADLSASERRLNSEDRPWVELLGPMRHAGGRSESLFVGRPLQAWLDHLRAISTGRTRGLNAAQRSAMLAGAALAEMTLCMAEDNRAGVTAAEARVHELLPEETFRQLFR